MMRESVAPISDLDALPGRAGASAPRIGILQAEWLLQVHTVNPVLVLAESGFCVDLFLYRVDEDAVAGTLDHVPNVRVIRIGGEREHVQPQVREGAAKPSLTPREVIKRTVYRMALLRLLFEKSRDAYRKSFFVKYYPDWLYQTRWLLPASVLRETLRAMKGLQYRALIGVEKAGLVWAGQVAERIHVPYLYHNLQLYTKEYYGNAIIPIKQKCLMHAEKRYHRGSYATIIQDQARAEVLFADHRVKLGQVLYVPVSLFGLSGQARTSFFQDRFNLGNDRVLILQYGYLHSRRFCVELARLAQSFPERWKLVMHGVPASPEELQKIRAADTNQRVLFSLELAPYSRVAEVASSVHIGLALYNPSNCNDRLTILSSEKVALFLQCGIPIVTFDNPGCEVLEFRRCGAVIRSLGELPAAIERILASWDEFSYNARMLFAERYEFRANYRKVVEMLGSLPDKAA